MPIGDLLAQISGGRTTGSPAPAIQRLNVAVPIKRKANEDLSTTTPKKTPRLFAPSSKTPQRPTNGTSTRLTPDSSKPVSYGNRTAKPPVASKPSTALPPAPDKPKAPPKKGSYAEILARAQRAQAVMGQVGKIQHKKVEKGASKKEKEKNGAKAPPSATQAKKPSGYSGTAKPGQRNGANGNTPSQLDRNGTAARNKPVATTKKAPGVEVEKKVKKAVAATTGYTGTARPKPENISRKNAAPRGGALLNAPASRSDSSKRRNEDEYDEELDDFIDYDDDEEDGPQYAYASDATSDMEAGMDDIDDEERRAEQIARREDIEEERLEKSLKQAKEERKRKALETLRVKRR